MAIKVEGGYECGYCHKFFTNPNDAEDCKESHNLIYIALSEEDLNSIIGFIYSKEDGLISDKLIDRLHSYLRGGFNASLEKRNGL